MGFQKKTSYENIYDWAKNGEGTCYYCHKDKPIAYTIFSQTGKGVCQDCLDTFEIGHVGTDRHAIEYFTRDLKSHKAVVGWFKKMGVDLRTSGTTNGYYLYDAVNNAEDYNEAQYHLSSGEPLIDSGMKYLKSYNRIEISINGDLHIVY